MVVVKPEVHSIRLHSYSARRLYCVPFAGLVFLQANSGIVFRFRPRRTPSSRSISSVCLCVCIDEKFVPFFFVPLLGPRCRTLATFSLRLGYGTKIDFPGSGFRWLRAGFSHACFAFTPAHSQTVGRLSPRRPTLPRNRDRHEFLVCVRLPSNCSDGEWHSQFPSIIRIGEESRFGREMKRHKINYNLHSIDRRW